MIRAFLALSRQQANAIACGGWQGGAIAAADLVSQATFQSALLSASGRPAFERAYSDLPDPDPDVNPTPSANVVKIVDAIENLTVKEMVWLNKLLKERLGVSDAEMGMGMGGGGGMPMQAAPAAEAAPEEKKEEKTEFNVVIEGYEAPAKIKIIKEIRSVVPSLGLKEAKELVEKLPATVKTGVSKADADELQKKLGAVGARVLIT